MVHIFTKGTASKVSFNRTCLEPMTISLSQWTNPLFQTNVDEWLEEIGLPMYRDNFRRNHIRHPKEMEILKSFGRREIEKELGIIKDGRNLT